MYNDLNDEQIIIELRELISGVDSAKEQFDVYCEAVKHIMLSSSCNN